VHALLPKPEWFPFLSLLLVIFLITTGELFISPIGLSMVTRLSPAKVVSFHDGRLVPVYLICSVYCRYHCKIHYQVIWKPTAVCLDRGYTSGHRTFSPDIIAEKGVAGFNTLLSYTNVFTTIGVIAIATASPCND
jgi:proton-dependent oligopeptide transporter, POT family